MLRTSLTDPFRLNFGFSVLIDPDVSARSPGASLACGGAGCDAGGGAGRDPGAAATGGWPTRQVRARAIDSSKAETRV